MKIKKLVSILVGIALISFGIGLLSLEHFGYKNGIFKFVVDNISEGIQEDDSNYVEKNIDEEKLENIDGINTINVDVPFLDVNVIPENRDDVKIHYNGYIKANFIPKLKTERSSDILYISLEKKSHVSYNVKESDAKLDIYIPKTYEKNIKISTSFGDINIANLNISQLELDSNYGDIEIKNLNGDIKANISYGKMDIENHSGDLTATTSFGDIDLKYSNFDNNIDATTSYGDIKIELPKNSQFNIDATYSFGDIDIDFPVTISKNEKNRIAGRIGNSKNNIKLESDFGDIRIKSK